MRPLDTPRCARHLGVGILVLVSGLVGCAKHIPAPALPTARGEQLSAKGAYLASTMACIACHSQRDWSRYGGPPVAGTEFGGSLELGVSERFGPKFSLVAPNLTPHHLGEWTDGEIVRATLLGQSRDGRGLFPVMPYFEWRDSVALDDAAAVVAFLRTLSPLPSESPTPRLPMPGFVVNMLPEPRTLRERAPQPTEADYGEYVTYRSGCLGCHTPADRRGRYIGPPFSGGRVFPVPPPGGGHVRSANLTPDVETGLGRWTEQDFIHRFKQSTLTHARSQSVPAAGYNTVMPWWAYAELSEQDLGAIFAYLQTLPPTAHLVEKYSP